jgi:hypothetical protein
VLQDGEAHRVGDGPQLAGIGETARGGFHDAETTLSKLSFQ